jgi:hypothetical protein
MKDTKYVFLLKKKKKKQDISVLHLIKMYSNFVNFLCSWSSVDTMGIRGDDDGVINSSKHLKILIVNRSIQTILNAMFVTK